MIHEKRSIKELSVIYDQEPDLRDVYVEGQRDRGLITWYFGSDLPVCVYEASDIEVPSELVTKHGGAVGNRGRAIALARELESHVVQHERCRFAVVIDADCDYALGVDQSSKVLFRTDLANAEMYLHDSRVIQNFVDLHCPGKITDTVAVLSDMHENLQQIFALRSAIQSLRLNVSMIPFQKSIQKNGKLDFHSYVRQMAQTRGVPSQAIAILDESERLLSAFRGDNRRFMHGHDFITHLRLDLSRAKINQALIRNDESLSALLFSSLERDFLGSYPLFQSLQERLCGV